MSDELREQLADIQHAIWAHWMGYMFGCGEFRKDGTWVMPAEKLERWWRQKETPYSELSDKERESDRHQADKALAVVQPALAAANARAEAAEAANARCREANILLANSRNAAAEEWRQRAEAAEAALVAVPMEAIRRYFDHSDAYAAVQADTYEMHEGMNDCQQIAEWLGRRGEMQP